MHQTINHNTQQVIVFDSITGTTVQEPLVNSNIPAMCQAAMKQTTLSLNGPSGAIPKVKVAITNQKPQTPTKLSNSNGISTVLVSTQSPESASDFSYYASLPTPVKHASLDEILHKYLVDGFRKRFNLNNFSYTVTDNDKTLSSARQLPHIVDIKAYIKCSHPYVRGG